MYPFEESETAVCIKGAGGETGTVMEEYQESGRDPVPDEPFHPGRRGLWSVKKGLWGPEIFNGWYKKCKN